MKLSLRKAKQIQAAVQKALEAEVGKLSTKLNVSVVTTALEKLEELRGAATADFAIRWNEIKSLEAIQRYLRTEIDAANTKNGISELVTEQVSLRLHLRRLELLDQSEAGRTTTEVVQQFQANRDTWEKTTETYTRRNLETFGVPILTAELQEMLQQDSLATRRRIVEIQDTLDRLNMTVEIEIPDGDFQSLQQTGVI